MLGGSQAGVLRVEWLAYGIIELFSAVFDDDLPLPEYKVRLSGCLV